MNESRHSERLALVVNPHAAAGRAGRSLPLLRELVKARFQEAEVLVTEGPGHATRLTRQALGAGCQLVAAVGGDGTCNEVVNGFWDLQGAQINPEAVFTVVPCGTGSDLIRSMGIPRDTAAALDLARDGETRRIDLAQVSMIGPGGATVTRRCVNVTGFGANGDVVGRVNASSKKLGGRITFLGATLAMLMSYRPGEVLLRWNGPEGEERWEGVVMTAFVGNGHFCGGGMWIGRGGSMSDGLLDLTVLQPRGLLKSVTSLPRLYDGDLSRVDGCFRRKVTEFEASRKSTNEADILVDVDGEQLGKLPFKVSLLPSALLARGGWSAPA